jgi:2-isopropylmalate synthase
MEKKYGYTLPKDMLTEFATIVNDLSDAKHTVLDNEEIHQAFKDEYINLKEPLVLRSYTAQNDDMTTVISAEVEYKGKTSLVSGTGNGPLDALCVALRKLLGKDFEICAYTEHALERKSSSKAATYIAIKDNDDNESVFWGVGVHENISTASVYALISAVNRELSK